MLPETLDAFAERARREAKRSGAPTAQLAAFAEAAERLAMALKWLNFVSQDLLSNALRQTNDYAVRSVADAVRIALRLDDAATKALENRNKRGGPRPKRMIVQVVVWLAELWEYYGGKFTHNPRIKTDYKGQPQTAAGQFVAKFLEMCGFGTPDTAPSQFMAAAVAFRYRRRRQAAAAPSLCAEAAPAAIGDNQAKRLPGSQPKPWAPAAASPHIDLGLAPWTKAARSKDEPPP
ncbi:hypothetical protein [Bradyrhizobium vignae]|uniref:Uncharacterized protein n=1 Tax=Bradyrhizobium vignae TaxID=1549949 RepID=A0ABS4A0R7_9BRAD|nr:hypothetical protein [Bradyrhizobium vignae]MBP0113866.1 hypothetical protein [Bradyrhizobium vignae]